MKILHLQPELNLTCGITRTISQIIKNSSAEYEHHLITSGGDGLSRFDVFKLKPTIIQLNRFSIWEILKNLAILIKYCKKNSIQIIHSHHRYFDTLVWLLKPFLKVKSITSVQSKVYDKKIFSYKADKLIACSITIKKHLISNFNIIENRINIIYNAVDPSTIKIYIVNEQLKSQLGINLEDFVIGFVGRIDYEEKGIEILLEAFNLIAKVRFNTHLLIIGSGPNYKDVEDYINANNLKVTLLSSMENIFDFYNIMDVIVLPSRVDPFPLVMLETGIMHKPFIGSNVDGIAELIEHGKNGLLFKSGDADDLMNQIAKIIGDVKLTDTLANNLNNKILNSFTVQKIIPQYEKLYRDILNEVD